jgi:sialic acid synthase SpsE
MAVDVIAEIAEGYEGQPALAKVLVAGAIAAGADSVKLHLVLADELVTRSHPKHEFCRGLEMDPSVWAELAKLVQDAGKKLYLDIFGLASLAIARDIGVDGVKIHASDFHNDELVHEAISTFPSVLVSIGGVRTAELAAFLEEQRVDGHSPVRLMYGFQAYPTAVADNNLRRFQWLIGKFPEVSFGFMDHSAGGSAAAWHVPLMAVALGATTIEKHLTFAHNVELVDHWSALTPDEFGRFIDILREVEPALGDATTELSAKEETYRLQVLKVVVAARSMPAGHVLTRSDVALKRVSVGSADAFLRLHDVVGNRLRAGIEEDDPISREELS